MNYEIYSNKCVNLNYSIHLKRFKMFMVFKTYK